MILHCRYRPHFVYPFICGWLLGLLPTSDYCEKGCWKHGCTNIWSLLSILLRLSPEVELLYHMVVLLFIFKGSSILFSIAAVIIYNPTNSAEGFPLLHIHASTCYLLSFSSQKIYILSAEKENLCARHLHVQRLPETEMSLLRRIPAAAFRDLSPSHLSGRRSDQTEEDIHSKVTFLLP